MAVQNQFHNGDITITTTITITITMHDSLLQTVEASFPTTVKHAHTKHVLPAFLREARSLSYSSSQPWSVTGFWDDQLGDAGNFGLAENHVGTICAVLTGFSILLASDTLFRVVVRARRGVATSHVVYRRLLLSRAISPVEWIPPIGESLRRCMRAENGHNTHCELRSETQTASDIKSGRATAISTWHRVFIAVLGLGLLLLQLLLIFLATNRSSPVDIHLSQMPSFKFADPWNTCLLYTSPSPRDLSTSRMPSSA